MIHRTDQSQLSHLAWGAALLLAFTAFALPAIGDTVELANGDKLEVTIIDDSGDKIIADHPVFGRMEIPKDELKPPPPPKRRDRGLFGTRVLKGWKRRLAAGFGGSSGDSSEANVNLALTIENETDSYRGIFDSAYFYGSAAPPNSPPGTASTRTKNKFYGGYQHDLLFKESRWFLFGAAKYDYDEFQFWVHRIAGNAGVGYDIVKREKLNVRGKAGFGFAYEAGEAQTTNPEGVFGLIFDWAFYEGQKLHADTTYYPNFSNNPELRLLTNVSWVIELGFIDGLSLDLGVKHEFNTEADEKINPASGFPFARNNVNYYGNIGYAF